MKIADIQAREIFDSRGIPTVECDVVLDDGMIFTSSVPSGASRSVHEAHERRDGGKRLSGQGVLSVVDTIHTIIAPMFIGRKPHVVDMDIHMLEMDNTHNKFHLGANSISAVSMSIARAQAYRQGISLYECIAELSGNQSVSLPLAAFSFLSGLPNSGMQNFMLVPVSGETFQHAIDMAEQTFYTLRLILEKRNLFAGYSNDGGYVLLLETHVQAADVLMEAIEKAGFTDSIHLALSSTSSNFYDSSNNLYLWEGKYISAQDLIGRYKQLVSAYPFAFIQDGLQQDDLPGWRSMTDELCSDVSIVGADIFATDPQRIWEGIEIGSATSAVIKPSQIGTITEAIQAVNLCQEYDWGIVVSSRSGETNDTFIADFAVGSGAQYIVAGGCSRGERIAKYNRLLQIERELFL